MPVIECPKCGRQNPDSRRICKDCGEELPITSFHDDPEIINNIEKYIESISKAYEMLLPDNTILQKMRAIEYIIKIGDFDSKTVKILYLSSLLENDEMENRISRILNDTKLLTRLKDRNISDILDDQYRKYLHSIWMGGLRKYEDIKPFEISKDNKTRLLYSYWIEEKIKADRRINTIIILLIVVNIILYFLNVGLLIFGGIVLVMIYIGIYSKANKLLLQLREQRKEIEQLRKLYYVCPYCGTKISYFLWGCLSCRKMFEK
jgi:hypothetical protein